MRKYLFIFFLIIFSQISFSCYMLDSHFTLRIYNLSIDFDRLLRICTKETCKITSEYILTRSSYDNRVSLIFWLDGALEIKTPFYQDEYGNLKPVEINPENYDWKESVKNDLNTMRDLNIIKPFTLTDIEIEEIAKVAKNSKNIYYCNNWWKAFEANCRCPTDEEKRLGLEEICFRCIKNEFFYPQPPSKSFVQSEKIETKNKEKITLNMILLLIFLVLILSIILIFITGLTKA